MDRRKRVIQSFEPEALQLWLGSPFFPWLPDSSSTLETKGAPIYAAAEVSRNPGDTASFFFLDKFLDHHASGMRFEGLYRLTTRSEFWRGASRTTKWLGFEDMCRFVALSFGASFFYVKGSESNGIVSGASILCGSIELALPTFSGRILRNKLLDDERLIGVPKEYLGLLVFSLPEIQHRFVAQEGEWNCFLAKNNNGELATIPFKPAKYSLTQRARRELTNFVFNFVLLMARRLRGVLKILISRKSRRKVKNTIVSNHYRTGQITKIIEEFLA